MTFLLSSISDGGAEFQQDSSDAGGPRLHSTGDPPESGQTQLWGCSLLSHKMSPPHAAHLSWPSTEVRSCLHHQRASQSSAGLLPSSWFSKQMASMKRSQMFMWDYCTQGQFLPVYSRPDSRLGQGHRG